MKGTDPIAEVVFVTPASLVFIVSGVWFGFVRRRVPLRGGGVATRWEAIVFGVFFVGLGAMFISFMLRDLGWP